MFLMSFNNRYETKFRLYEVQTTKDEERNMGAMRMSDFYLAEVLRLSEWVIKNTNSNHSQNLRAKRLTKRVMKFINPTGHTQSVMTYINEDRNRARLFDDE